MNNVVICDSTRGRLIMCDIEKAQLKSVHLSNQGKSCASHDLSANDKKIYVANSGGNSVSIVDKSTFRLEYNFYGGSIPEDVLAVDSYIFVACGGTNSIDVFDAKTLDLLVTIPVKDFPHDLSYDSVRNRVFVANFIDSSISVIDVDTLQYIDSIKSNLYPTKVLVSQKHNMLLCCESCLGEKYGYLEIFNLENLQSIARVQLGKNPLGLCIDKEKAYISNLDDGTISIVDLKTLKLDGNIYLGGNLNCLCRVGKYLCVGDRKESRLVVVDLERCIKKIIALGGEPNAIDVLI